MKHNPFDSDNRRRRFDQDGLTRRILGKTSGGACPRAEELLGARWDGALATVDQELLDDHLAHCAGCRELALILDHLQPLMPTLAERAVDPVFTTRVMAATTGVAGARPARTPRLDGLARRLADLGTELWNRPRFALEAAWTATALAALLMWSPLGQSLGAEKAVTAGAGLAPEVVTWVETRVDAAETAIHDLFDMSTSEALERLNTLGTGAQERGRTIMTKGQALFDGLSGRDHADDSTSEPRDPDSGGE